MYRLLLHIYIYSLHISSLAKKKKNILHFYCIYHISQSILFILIIKMYRNFHCDFRRFRNFWTTHGMAPFISLWVRIYKLTSYPPGLWPHCATPWVRSSKEFYWNMTVTWPFIRPTSNLWSGRPSKRSSVRLPKAKLTTSLPRFERSGSTAAKYAFTKRFDEKYFISEFLCARK